MIQLDPSSTALVLIDLQKGIAAQPGLQPYEGADVIARAKALAAKFREAGAPVVLVHVGFRPGEAPSSNVDQPSLPKGGTPPEFSELVDGLREDGDIVVLKHHWGAFIGTDLDLQLRRRGVKTIVLGGVSTNFGVESTLRSGWELSYDMIVAENACSARDADQHRFAFETIFPRITRVCAAETLEFGAGR